MNIPRLVMHLKITHEAFVLLQIYANINACKCYGISFEVKVNSEYRMDAI